MDRHRDGSARATKLGGAQRVGERAPTRIRDQLMLPEKPQVQGPMEPLDWLKLLSYEPDASSEGLGWVSLDAVRSRARGAVEATPPALTHHWLVLFERPPEQLALLYGGVDRHESPPAGSISLLPAGSPSFWRSSGRRDLLHVYVEPGLVAQVASEVFGLDPARMSVGPLDAMHLPRLRTAMLAVGAELTTADAGSQLAVESLANVLAVEMLRQALAPRQPEQLREMALSQARLAAVVEYVEEHLGAALTLKQMARAAHLSAYHFARQFKAATGTPPHQYVIARRVERAQQLLQTAGDLSLAEIAARAGFSDQSQLSKYFKRAVGLTPMHYRRRRDVIPSRPR
jgi:AraC family transcriptional regulator